MPGGNLDGTPEQKFIPQLYAVKFHNVCSQKFPKSRKVSNILISTTGSHAHLHLDERTFQLEAVMDCDVVDGLSQHNTDECNDMQVGERLR